MKEIKITDIEGIRVGNAQNIEAGTGCTVIICEKGGCAGVDVRGGGPASHETELLNPVNTVDRVHGIVLSGGSAFGLEATSGVMQYLEERGIGFDVGIGVVPIVCGASLFNLTVGSSKVRPDKAMGIEKTGYVEYVGKLSEVSGIAINSFKTFVEALKERVKFFVERGCLVTDLSLEEPFFKIVNEEEIERIFQKALTGAELTAEEREAYKTMLFVELGREYKKYDLGMQIHMGALRNNNSRMFDKLGADIGMDSIADNNYAKSLSSLLNELEKTGELPKTILYCLNPKDNEVLGTMIGNFQCGEMPGKMQFGSGWWFLDQKDGMIKQMTALANLGLLRRFVGMLTDSRSFISYTRHEYFRRIMCNLIGTWVEEGEVPFDEEILKAMVQEICYLNAKNYFKLEI